MSIAVDTRVIHVNNSGHKGAMCQLHRALGCYMSIILYSGH